MLILNASEVAQVFDMKAAFASTKEAAIAVTSGAALSPPRTALHAEGPSAEVLVMPGVVDQRLVGTKTWYSYGTPLASAPGTAAFITVLDPDLGEEVLVEGSLITDFRTGALSGLAAEKLAPEQAETLTVIGAGIQARTQILAVLHARPRMTTILVSSRTPSRREAFVEQMQQELKTVGYEVTVQAAEGPAAAVAAGDVVVAATTSSSPVIQDEWITKPEVLICGVGSHDLQSTELQPATVGRAQTVVVDSYTGGLDGAADISGPVSEGVLERSKVIELGDLVQQSSPNAGGISVFKSVGFSAADIVAAAQVARAGAAAGLGHRVDLHS